MPLEGGQWKICLILLSCLSMKNGLDSLLNTDQWCSVNDIVCFDRTPWKMRCRTKNTMLLNLVYGIENLLLRMYLQCLWLRGLLWEIDIGVLIYSYFRLLIYNDCTITRMTWSRRYRKYLGHLQWYLLRTYLLLLNHNWSCLLILWRT